MTANEELRERMAEQMEFVLSQTPEALQAENVKLRVERDEWHRVAESKQDIIDHMRDANAENAKLRELVKEMRVCFEDECKRCHEWGDACDLEHQMRELGVEVGE